MADAAAQKSDFDKWRAERKEFLSTTYGQSADDLFMAMGRWGAGRWGGYEGRFDEVEDNIFQLLGNLGETNPEFALTIANGWMLRAGDVSTKFKAKIMEFEASWKREIAQNHAAEEARLKRAKHVKSPLLTPGEELGPHRPDDQSTGASVSMSNNPGDDIWTVSRKRT